MDVSVKSHRYLESRFQGMPLINTTSAGAALDYRFRGHSGLRSPDHIRDGGRTQILGCTTLLLLLLLLLLLRRAKVGFQNDAKQKGKQKPGDENECWWKEHVLKGNEGEVLWFTAHHPHPATLVLL